MIDSVPDGPHTFAAVLEDGFDLCFKGIRDLRFGINCVLARDLNDSSIGRDFCNCRMGWWSGPSVWIELLHARDR